MGNCCCGGEEKGGRSNAPFQGEGRRLGTVGEPRANTTPLKSSIDRDDEPAPTYNDNLTAEEREKQRAARAAAAEARVKATGGATKAKKKDTSGEPLRGPNTQNTMRWTAG